MGPSLTKVHQTFSFLLISSSSQRALVLKKRRFHKQAFVYSSVSAVFQKLRVIHLTSTLMTNFPTIEFKVQSLNCHQLAEPSFQLPCNTTVAGFPSSSSAFALALFFMDESYAMLSRYLTADVLNF